jgi:hypothetical protein
MGLGMEFELNRRREKRRKAFLKLIDIWVLGILFFCCSSIQFSKPANAEPTRRAFIVGIANYEDEALRLLGPKNDGPLIAKQLSRFAFEQVTLVDEENTTFKRLSDQWLAFLKSVRPGDAVVVYFSGHGVAVNNLNYLVPRDFHRSDMARSADAAKLKLLLVEKWRADLVARRAAISVWIFDACRDNQIGLESKGLVSMSPLSGNLIMYSAKAGQESSDSSDRKQPSIYTRYFLAALNQMARQDAVILARTVQSEVAALQNNQLPELSVLMGDNWCFNICDPKLIIKLKLDTPDGSYEAPSKRAFAQSKSIGPVLRRQNALFVGTKSQAQSCFSSQRQDNLRFDCSVLKNIASGNFKTYLKTGVTPLTKVSIYRRPPIVKEPTIYMCRVGTIDKSAATAITGFLSFEYQHETYYWATTKERREICLAA